MTTSIPARNARRISRRQNSTIKKKLAENPGTIDHEQLLAQRTVIEPEMIMLHARANRPPHGLRTF
jgi:hypothetical protein